MTAVESGDLSSPKHTDLEFINLEATDQGQFFFCVLQFEFREEKKLLVVIAILQFRRYRKG